VFDNLVPNIGRHFLYCTLNHDDESGLHIVNLVQKLSPAQIAEFLVILGGSLDYLFAIMESVPEYSTVKAYTIAQLHSPDEPNILEEYD